jgi:hypothetical protein
MNQIVLILIIIGIIGVAVYYSSTSTSTSTTTTTTTSSKVSEASQKIKNDYITYFGKICDNYPDFKASVLEKFGTADIFNVIKNSTGTTFAAFYTNYLLTTTNPTITDFDSKVQNWFLTLLILPFPSSRLYVDASGNYAGAGFGITPSSTLSASQQVIVKTFFNTILLPNADQTTYPLYTSAYLDSVKGPQINTDIINYLTTTSNPTNKQFYDFMTTEFNKFNLFELKFILLFFKIIN